MNLPGGAHDIVTGKFLNNLVLRFLLGLFLGLDLEGVFHLDRLRPRADEERQHQADADDQRSAQAHERLLIVVRCVRFLGQNSTVRLGRAARPENRTYPTRIYSSTITASV